MLITDHINFMGTNPLIGPNDEHVERFPDMSTSYSKKFAKWRNKLRKQGLNM